MRTQIEPPEFQCKSENYEDDWSDCQIVMKCWTHEMAALDFAEAEWSKSDYPNEQTIDVRRKDQPSIVKRFVVTANQDVRFSAIESNRHDS